MGIAPVSGRPSSTSIQANPGVSETARSAPAQGAAPAQEARGTPAASGDQYSTARAPGAGSGASSSTDVPDTLRRGGSGRESTENASSFGTQNALTMPADTIKAANQKVVDEATSKVQDLVKKGDPASLKAAVDKLFTLKEPELAGTLQKLKDSGDLKKLYNESSDGNKARLSNTVMGHGSEESKKTFGDGIKKTRQEILDEARNFGGLAKKMEEQNKNSPPTQEWGKPNPNPSNPNMWRD
jgi:hypothetical protein